MKKEKRRKKSKKPSVPTKLHIHRIMSEIFVINTRNTYRDSTGDFTELNSLIIQPKSAPIVRAVNK